MTNYNKFLLQEHPHLQASLDAGRLPLFEETLTLSASAFQSMSSVVKQLFLLKKDKNYLDAVFQEAPMGISRHHFQDAALMAYDFHIDEEGCPRLIEVNTNASGFLLANSFYQYKGLSYKKSLASLEDSFKAEWSKFQTMKKGSSLKPCKVVLIDQDITQQKMYIEFLMYKDFFQSFGWSLEICEASSLSFKDSNLFTSKNEKVDFIYNRSTDFYFEDSPSLLKAYQEQSCCITPHPREYFLLSDKKRLALWFLHKDEWPLLKSISQNLISSGILNSKNQEQVWSNKARYFFKPLLGYSGKKVYRGSGLTRSKFNTFSQDSFLFQEHIPPSRWKDSQGEDWKVDFRVFAYEDKIQQIMARCYKGQLTNFKEDKSGFALVQVL